MAQIDACKAKIDLLRMLMKCCVFGFFAYIILYLNIDEPSNLQKIFFASFFVIDIIIFLIINKKLMKEIKKLGEL